MLPKSPQWFLTMLTAHLTTNRPELMDGKMKINDIPSDQMEQSYDFIVIGAGTAGSVMANRLSENSSWTVLVLEAGGEENEFSDTPVLIRDNWLSHMDWNFTTTKNQKGCMGMEDGKCMIPRGKVVGGSSSINMMMYIRGNKYDYENWESMENLGWNYENAKKYFLKGEDMRIPELAKSEYHSSGGPISVEYPAYKTPLREAYIEAGKELGYKNRDYNGEFQSGISFPQFTMREGMRCSSGKGYLRPAKERPNLHIALGATVNKLHFDKENVIKEVEYMRNGKTYKVKPNKEVILSAGVFNSPKILMLSGIGNKDHLKELNIPLVHDAMVGDYLQDQISVPVFFKVKQGTGLTRAMIENEEAINMYTKDKKGPLTSPVGIEAVGFFHLKNNTRDDDSLPEIQMVAMSYIPMETKDPYIVLTINKLRPESRGTLRLANKDPSTPPLIDPKYYSAGSDLKDTVEGCLLGLQFSRTKALKQFSLEVDTTWTPKCSQAKEDRQLCQCLVDNYSNPMYSAVGTTRMGHPKYAAKSVVCPRLRVHGVKGVRLADSSVMPQITSGDTHAPTLMIAEMGADYIKHTWTKKLIP